MYIKYHKMAIVMACLNCYGIPNLLVPTSARGLLEPSQTIEKAVVEVLFSLDWMFFFCLMDFSVCVCVCVFVMCYHFAQMLVYRF